MTKFNLITLPENFRSAKAICRAASKLIAHNPDRVKKEIVPVRQDEGIVAVRIFETERDEAKFILNHIGDLTEKPRDETIFDWVKPTIAVLCRTNSECVKFADELMNAGFKVGMRKTGKESLPEGWETLRTTLGFFANPNSDYAAVRFLETIWPKPQVALNRATAIKAGRSLNEIALNFPSNPATDPTSMRGFLDSKSAVPLATIDWLCERLKEMPSGLSMGDIVLFLNEFETRGHEPDENVDVHVLTIHSAKSKEWNHCIISGLSEGFFPRGNDDILSERRLMYVGMTRARDSLLVTCPKSRWTKWNGLVECEVSRFAKELQ